MKEFKYSNHAQYVHIIDLITQTGTTTDTPVQLIQKETKTYISNILDVIDEQDKQKPSTRDVTYDLSFTPALPDEVMSRELYDSKVLWDYSDAYTFTDALTDAYDSYGRGTLLKILKQFSYSGSIKVTEREGQYSTYGFADGYCMWVRSYIDIRKHRMAFESECKDEIDRYAGISEALELFNKALKMP